MNITVYLGANEGNDPALKQAVEELGRWIGESGNALVYGGSRSGLMGRLAHSVLTAGGEVTGVGQEGCRPHVTLEAGQHIFTANSSYAERTEFVFTITDIYGQSQQARASITWR